MGPRPQDAPGAQEFMLEPQSDAAGVLRVIACGSVDDGKSTLIGRLLHDAKAIHMDQLDAVRTASAARTPGQLDLSLLTDGLRAERAQGITIDVAYRFFTTHRRRFILADTPGHAHYTRNMVTGASTADAAMIVLDARNGVVEQTRRHACIAALLGVPRLFVCVNKMDLVGFERGRFERVRDDFLRLASSARPDAGATVAERTSVSILPTSALRGDNVVERSAHMPWSEGASLLDQLEACPDRPSLEQARVRLAVQCVIRPPSGSADQSRVYGGRMGAGMLSVGDSVVALPSRRRSIITSIHVGWQAVSHCSAPASVSITLRDDIGLERGETLVSALDMDNPELAPFVTHDVEATVVWMGSQPLVTGQRVLVKHGCRVLSGVVRSLADRFSVQTLELEPKIQELRLNHIGRVGLRFFDELACDPYRLCRETGSFILIDEESNNTVGAGMIVQSTGGMMIADDRGGVS